MKRTLVIILLLCILTAGCSAGGSNKGTIHVVESYLNNSISGNWEELNYRLSGEALAEFRVNSTRVQSKGTIIDVDYEVNELSDGIAEVKADVLVKYGDSLDRVAYDFKLKKFADDWKIYKATYGDYLHAKLKQGNADQKAIDTAKKYMELPFEEKRTAGINYLAGKLRQEALRSAAMPIDEATVKKQANVQTKVKQINCLGKARGFIMLNVDYETIVEGKKYSQQAIVEMVALEDEWKIGNIDISQ